MSCAFFYISFMYEQVVGNPAIETGMSVHGKNEEVGMLQNFQFFLAILLPKC